MGYRRSPKVYQLSYEQFPGLEITARSVPVGELLDILKLADSMAAEPSQQKIAKLFKWFADKIIAWNYEDEDGKPLEPTLKTLQGEEFDFIIALITGWVKAISSAAVPLAQASNGMSRRDPVEESIPMSSSAGTK